MILTYGNYSHQDAELWFDIVKLPLYSDIGVRRGFRETWVIRGRVQGSTPVLVAAAMAGLRDAYSVNRGDLVFVDNDSVLTDHTFYDSTTTGGIRVVDFRWLQNRDTEVLLRRSYQIVLTGDVYDQNQGVLAWKEKITSVGNGGPRFDWVQTLNGPPVKQLVQQRTTFLTIQEGMAIGEFSTPLPATPIWPDDNHTEKNLIQVGTPKFVDGQEVEFGVKWRYVHESASKLIGSPTPF